MNQKTFYDLKKYIKTEDNYIPRNYKSIGGMWTVDTWKKDNFILQIYDEGATSSITFMKDDKPAWKAIDGYTGLKLENISSEDFQQFLNNTLEEPVVKKNKHKP